MEICQKKLKSTKKKKLHQIQLIWLFVVCACFKSISLLFFSVECKWVHCQKPEVKSISDEYGK